MDIGLVELGIGGVGQSKPVEARIAGLARVGGRDRVAAERIEVERAPLEAVGDLFAAAANFDEVVAVARLLEERELLLFALARERIGLSLIEGQELQPALIGDRELGDEFRDRLAVAALRRDIVAHHGLGIAGRQHVAAEALAREKDAARELKRRIEHTLERGLEAVDVDAELFDQVFGERAVERFWGLHRLAAAVAKDEPRAEPELVALGVAAEIVVVVEDENAGARTEGAPVEPGGRKPADAGADDHEIVALLDRQPAEREGLAVAQLMSDLERAGMVSTHAGERRRVAEGLRGKLPRRRQPGRDRQRGPIEEVAPGDRGHSKVPPQPMSSRTACAAWS